MTKSNAFSVLSSSFSEPVSDAAPSASIPISWPSGSKISTPISPGKEQKPGRASDDRPSLPDHLPREDVKLDISADACPCCGGAIHKIGEAVSEMLDYVPARLRVLRIRRPKYGCRACGTIHQAPAPERPIAKGFASPGLLAHVLVSKYCDHLPLSAR